MRFVLVDRILTLDPGRTITAVKTLGGDEELFADHFPGFPVVPGVLLVEMMAQAAGKCLDAEDDGRGKAMLGKVLSAGFRDWVRPDQEILLEAEVIQSRPAFAKTRCAAQVKGKKVASAELFFAFLPLSQFSPDYRDEVLESFLAARRPPRVEGPDA